MEFVRRKPQVWAEAPITEIQAGRSHCALAGLSRI